jgi:hypothetical protein
MKWLSEFIQQKHFKQLQVEHLVDLSLINQPDINLVYFKRAVDDDITLFAQNLIEQSFKGINAVVDSESVDTLVTEQLNSMGLFTVGKVKFAQDLVEITRTFLRVTNAYHVRLILKVISDNACRKFHTDAYDLRLLCTYVGKGTEWIEDKYVNRSKIKVGSNEDIIKDFSQVKSTQPFEVAILKGEIPARPKIKGIVHRSPPIEQVGEKRLLLRIDY